MSLFNSWLLAEMDDIWLVCLKKELQHGDASDRGDRLPRIWHERLGALEAWSCYPLLLTGWAKVCFHRTKL